VTCEVLQCISSRGACGTTSGLRFNYPRNNIYLKTEDIVLIFNFNIRYENQVNAVQNGALQLKPQLITLTTFYIQGTQYDNSSLEF
jgi:hypothetical protein